ncbi:MAG: hypothetical protein JSW71_07545 [Gemmatimonadota bacterium]|nr:MAG: hypothetical protein JSW71_07545 [Gemmatimonadota bacterium]
MWQGVGGSIVQKGSTTEFLPAGLGRRLPGSIGDAGLWNDWQAVFRNPQLRFEGVPAEAARGATSRRKSPPLPPATDLTIKVDDVVEVQGSEEVGITIKVDGCWLVAGGEASITIEVDDA